MKISVILDIILNYDNKFTLFYFIYCALVKNTVCCVCVSVPL